MPRFKLTLLAIVLAAGTASAQQTFIVDAAAGIPFDFIDLPAAEAASADGDTIFVRPGSYAPITTGKGLHIQFLPGAAIQSGVFNITGVPAGEEFVMTGFFGTATPVFGTALCLSSNLGRVHLDRTNAGRGVTIDGSPHVTMSSCTVGPPGLVITGGSAVFAQLSDFYGKDAGTPTKLSLPTPAITAVNSTLVLAQCTATGGDGSSGPFAADAAPAVDAIGSTARISGDARSVLSAGTQLGVVPVPAVVLSAGTLQLSSTVVLLPQAGAPGVTGTHVPIPVRPAAMTAVGGGPGSMLTIETISDQGDVLAAFIALPDDLLATAGGPFGLNASTLGLLSTSIQGSSEVWNLSFTLPPVPEIEGLVIGLQAVSISVVGVETLSNHLVIMLVD